MLAIRRSFPSYFIPQKFAPVGRAYFATSPHSQAPRNSPNPHSQPMPTNSQRHLPDLSDPSKALNEIKAKATILKDEAVETFEAIHKGPLQPAQLEETLRSIPWNWIKV